MSGDLFDQFIAAQGAPKVSPPAPAGAPDLFDSFLLAHGAGDAPQPQAPSKGASGDIVKDAARVAGTVAANAAVGTLAPARSLMDIGARAQDAVKKRYGVNPGPPADTSPVGMRDTMLGNLGTSEYVPETWLGRRGMDMATGAVMGMLGGGGLRALPATLGGSFTAGAAAEQFPEHPQLAATLGFFPGAAAGRWLGNLALRPAGGPLPVEDARLAETAMNNGIPLAPGQLSNNRLVNNLYSEGGRLPLSGAEGFRETQQRALNRATAGSFGETADRITPDVLLRARDRIGNNLDAIAQRTPVTFDPQLGADLTRILQTARQVLTNEEFGPVARQVQNVIGSVQPGAVIPGETYQALTRKGTPLDVAKSSANPNIAYTARQIGSALENALERSAAPQDVAALREARAQWKALRTVEPVTVRADTSGGSTPSTGDISPAALRGAVNKSYDRAPLAPLGQIPLNDLAKIGQRFLKEPPDSGTAGRTLAQQLIRNGIPTAAGIVGGIGGATGGPLPALAGAAGLAGGTLGLNRLAQELLRSQYLANRAVQGSLNPNGFNFIAPDAWQRLAVPAALAPAQLSTGPRP